MDARELIENFGEEDEGVLNFEGLGLDTLPEETEKIGSAVTQLWLTRNSFAAPPVKQLATLASLRVLAMEHNRITSVKGLATSDGGVLQSLKVLHLDENEITHIDGQLFRSLPNLEWLSARNNKISSLPPEVGLCTKLEGLRLTHNLLTTLPEEIGNLTNLLCLDLEHNKLESLPLSIQHLTKLEGLLLEQNTALKDLPMCIMCLSSLTDFTIDPHRQGNSEGQKEVWHYHVHSLLDICCTVVRAGLGVAFEVANIPLELKEKLRTEAKRCHYISCQKCNVYFGEGGVVEKVSSIMLLQQSVTLRAAYCCAHCACTDCIRKHPCED